mmetsp:Transcript_88656/g.251342  ORF Transcript_88656/g.251342 Transcript_88656/m.251342 type:complete len:236 (+) Transcript_88656:909-1616(+)
MNLAMAAADFAEVNAPFLDAAIIFLGSLLIDSLFPDSFTALSAAPATIMCALESMINIDTSPILSSMPWQSFLAFSRDRTARVGSPVPRQDRAMRCRAYACPFRCPEATQMLIADSALWIASLYILLSRCTSAATICDTAIPFLSPASSKIAFAAFTFSTASSTSPDSTCAILAAQSVRASHLFSFVSLKMACASLTVSIASWVLVLSRSCGKMCAYVAMPSPFLSFSSAKMPLA